MTEEHKLILTLVPKFDADSLSASMSGTVTAAGAAGSQSQITEAGESAQQDSGSTEAGQSADRQGFWSKIGTQFRNFTSGVMNRLHRTKSSEEEDDEKSEAEAKRNEKRLKIITTGVQQGARGLMSIAQTSLGFVEDIYKQMKSASPLLQAVESMFNLAVRLFFMPLGNKLGTILIPATVTLVDEVTKIWDSFEGQSLGEIFTFALREGTRVFGQYISDIGETLKNEEGLVGTIGRLLTNIGNFVEHKLEGVLNALLNFAGFVMEHFKGFISLYVAMQTAQISATIASGAGPLAALVASLAGGGLGFAGTEGMLRSFGLAEGGYVPATPGGQLHLLAEGGEGEYVIPESQVGNLKGGNTTINYYINGYTDNELKSIIRDTVDEQISRSRISSSF